MCSLSSEQLKKHTMKSRTLSLVLIIFLASNYSAIGQFRKYSNDFLNIGVGARALGMSSAQVASVDDVTSGYWNPAGLLSISENMQIAAMHSEYFAGIAKYDYAAFAKPLTDKSKAIGFSIIRFGVDDIPNTLFLKNADGSINYDNITSFSVADYAFIGSFASTTPIEGLSWGVNAKIIHRTVGDMAHSWGIGADAGAQFKKGNWKFGFMAKDITTTFNAWSFTFTDDEAQALLSADNIVPTSSTELTAPKFILGACYDYKIGDKFSLNPEINIALTTDGKENVLIPSKFLSVDPKIGVEANYMKTIYLRAGIGNFQKATNDIDGGKITTMQPNIGVGLHIKKIMIDYALTNVGNFSSSLYSNVFSLRFSLNNKTQ